jgi:hypothetical protein
MPTIMDFQAQMKDFMRPNKFNVEIGKTKTGSRERFVTGCFQAQIPGNTIATTDKDIGFRSVAYQTIYSDMILGFYCDSKMRELKFWQDWINSIHKKETNQWAYYDDYKSEITITPIDRKDRSVATWTLHDAYPKQIDPIQLDYGTNDAVMTINATITYRHFTVKWLDLVNEKQVKMNNAEPLYAVSSNTDLNKIDPMLELRKEGWKFGHEQISTEEFMEMYPNWEKMDAKSRSAALKLYGIGKESMSGGAFHMVDKIQ